jgi:hypothetical protein
MLNYELRIDGLIGKNQQPFLEFASSLGIASKRYDELTAKYPQENVSLTEIKRVVLRASGRKG